jgi:pimeloyl-ACP methyl ester carboxylesterase
MVRLNGIEMHYRRLGAGEPLVLLHGFGGCGDQWEPFNQALAKQFDVVIPDLRGHGWSTNSVGTFTHRQAADDVVALLDHLALKRVRAIGASTGGMTLLHVATRYPKRLDAMVLVGATSYFPPQARAIMAAGPEKTPPAVREMQLKCAKRGGDQARELSAQFIAFKDSYEDMNFTAPYLSTITARTLIVHGDRDIFFPVNIAVEMYEAIPRSELWIVPRGAHIPIGGSQSGAFLDIATEFLQRK